MKRLTAMVLVLAMLLALGGTAGAACKHYWFDETDGGHYPYKSGSYIGYTYSYSNGEDGKHLKWSYGQYNCTQCGALAKTVEAVASQWEVCTYVNGYCSCCGAAQVSQPTPTPTINPATCTHSDKTLLGTYLMKHLPAASNNDTNHFVDAEHTYSCNLCSTVFTEWEEVGMEPHTFERVRTETETEIITYDYCTGCGSTFNREVTVRKCSHSWDGMQGMYFPQFSYTKVAEWYEYSPYKGSTDHSKKLMWTVTCNACGETVTNVRADYYAAEQCTYQNGVCTKCNGKKPGYTPVTPTPTVEPITPAPVTPPPTDIPVTEAPTTPAPVTPVPVTPVPGECSHEVTRTQEGTIWEPKDDENHLMKAHYRVSCECGQVNELQHVTAVYPHQLVDGVCRLCGYVSEMGRYKLYTVSEYFNAQEKTLWMSVGTKMQIFVNDRVTGITYTPDALDERFSLRQIDTSDCAILNEKNELVVIKGGSLLISLYLGEELIDYIDVRCTNLDVDESEFIWEDTQHHTSTITNYDLMHMDWNECNVALATTIAIENYLAKREVNPITGEEYYLVTFNAYNSSPMVIGVASYDAEDKIFDQVLLDGFWPESTWGGKIVESFAATGRVFDGRSGNEQWTQKTEVMLRVPIGGYIHVQQMNDDDRVLAANLGQAVIATIDDASAIKGLLKPEAISEFRAALNSVEKAELNEMIWNYMVNKYSADAVAGSIKDIEKDWMLDAIKIGASNFEELLADEEFRDSWTELCLEVAWELMKEIGGSAAVNAYDGFEDFMLNVVLTPKGYYALEVLRVIIDEGRYSKALLEGFANCIVFDSNYRYIEYIKFPEM